MTGPLLRELTPVGPGAVSVLRLEGPGALERAESWSGRQLVPGELFLVQLTVGGTQIDEALVHPLDEESVELHLHGSPPLVQGLLREVGTAPVASGLEARAAELLARSPGEEGARILLDQAEGALRRELETLLAEADDEFFAGLERLERRSKIARFALEPARVVLAGPVNAGKSTLFNLLAVEERVITSDAAGTTRDVIAEPVLLGVWPAILIDTAGSRDLPGESGAERIESAAHRLGERARRGADLVLWLRPPGAPAPPAESGGPPRVVVLGSMSDLAGGDSAGISATADPEGARDRVEERFRSTLGLPERVWEPGRGLAFDGPLRSALALARASPAEEARRELCRLMKDQAHGR